MQRYPLRAPALAAALREQLRTAVLSERPPEPRTVALISLAHACRLTSSFVFRDERKAAKLRVKELTAGEIVGEEVAEAVREAEEAAAGLGGPAA